MYNVYFQIIFNIMNKHNRRVPKRVNYTSASNGTVSIGTPYSVFFSRLYCEL